MRRLERGCVCAEERRAERDASEHLADDLRLADASHERAGEAGGHEDHDDLGEQQRDVRRAGRRWRYASDSVDHSRRNDARRRCDRARGADERLAYAQNDEQCQCRNSDECRIGRKQTGVGRAQAGGRQRKSEPTSGAYVKQVRQATETVALAQPYRLKSVVAV
jgi:hypothetical protein